MEPITRSEQFLAAILGEDVVLPIPQSRIEYYLNAIAQNGIAPSSAGLINYDPDANYPDGSIGKEMHTLDGDVDQLKSEIDGFGDTYAKQDGSYDSMTVGNAKQLVATVGVEDKVPYLFRTTGGSADVGDRKTMELVGGTVAWNQLVQNGNFTEKSDWTQTTGQALTWEVANNTAILHYGVTSASAIKRILQYKSIVQGHVYLITFDAKATADKSVRCYAGSEGASLSEIIVPLVGGADFVRISRILTGKETIDRAGFVIGVKGSVAEGGEFDLSIRNVMIIDLTLLFGVTIADYINTLETGTAGTGVAWFRKLFPKDYYEYNAGELMSVKTSAQITTGFNAYNHASGTAKLVGGNAYQITGTYTALSYSTGETITPDSSGYFTRSTSGVLTVTGGDATTTCVHLVWDGERDGEYEPYVSHEYALDPDLELRGIPKLDSDNALYYDGDTYEADGTVTRKYGIVDLGALSWTTRATGSVNVLYSSMLPNSYSGKSVAGLLDMNWVAANYPYAGVSNASVLINDVDVTTPGVYSFANNGASTKVVYLVLPVGVATTNAGTLVYELENPTTESADPFQTPQIVDDFGTEEFVDTRDVPIPVGHDTTYQANLRAKLEMAPDSPSGDGDYIVRQTNGQNAYVPITFPADELPAAPTEDGSYVLKVAVASGVATYTWEAQS